MQSIGSMDPERTSAEERRGAFVRSVLHHAKQQKEKLLEGGALVDASFPGTARLICSCVRAVMREEAIVNLTKGRKDGRKLERFSLDMAHGLAESQANWRELLGVWAPVAKALVDELNVWKKFDPIIGASPELEKMRGNLNWLMSVMGQLRVWDNANVQVPGSKGGPPVPEPKCDKKTLRLISALFDNESILDCKEPTLGALVELLAENLALVEMKAIARELPDLPERLADPTDETSTNDFVRAVIRTSFPKAFEVAIVVPRLPAVKTRMDNALWKHTSAKMKEKFRRSVIAASMNEKVTKGVLEVEQELEAVLLEVVMLGTELEEKTDAVFKAMQALNWAKAPECPGEECHRPMRRMSQVVDVAAPEAAAQADHGASPDCGPGDNDEPSCHRWQVAELPCTIRINKDPSSGVSGVCEVGQLLIQSGPAELVDGIWRMPVQAPQEGWTGSDGRALPDAGWVTAGGTASIPFLQPVGAVSDLFAALMQAAPSKFWELTYNAREFCRVQDIFTMKGLMDLWQDEFKAEMNLTTREWNRFLAVDAVAEAIEAKALEENLLVASRTRDSGGQVELVRKNEERKQAREAAAPTCTRCERKLTGNLGTRFWHCAQRHRSEEVVGGVKCWLCEECALKRPLLWLAGVQDLLHYAYDPVPGWSDQLARLRVALEERRQQKTADYASAFKVLSGKQTDFTDLELAQIQENSVGVQSWGAAVSASASASVSSVGSAHRLLQPAATLAAAFGGCGRRSTAAAVSDTAQPAAASSPRAVASLPKQAPPAADAGQKQRLPPQPRVNPRGSLGGPSDLTPIIAAFWHAGGPPRNLNGPPSWQRWSHGKMSLQARPLRSIGSVVPAGDLPGQRPHTEIWGREGTCWVRGGAYSGPVPANGHRAEQEAMPAAPPDDKQVPSEKRTGSKEQAWVGSSTTQGARGEAEQKVRRLLAPMRPKTRGTNAG